MSFTKIFNYQRLILYGVILLLVLALVAVVLERPLPPLMPQTPIRHISAPQVSSSIIWPTNAQSAIGIVGTSIIIDHQKSVPLPTASTAKVLTALTVLSQKPLQLGQQGPIITLTQDDVNSYNDYLSHNGSVVPVVVGEQISEYQMLQAMMLPSANNIADSLARWAFGSLTNYALVGNQYALKLGMINSHVGTDASGFDPSTTSTAADLVKLGEAAMNNPVLSSIVGQTKATGIPDTDTLINVNKLLGQQGIIGVKTGNTDQAGGVYISASRITLNERPITIITAVIGSTSLYSALSSSLPMITSAQNNFGPLTIIKAGAIVGSYRLPWGGTREVKTAGPLTVEGWKSNQPRALIIINPLNNRHPSPVVGQITSTQTVFDKIHTTKLILDRPISQPSIWWRLLHPLY